MRRLCPVQILCFIAYLSILRVPFNWVKFAVGAAGCDNKVSQCANLGNLSAPFWGDASCAASDSFVINCSGEQASWEAFEDEAVEGSPLNASPQLTGINRSGDYTYINLTWTLADALKLNACAPPFPSADVDKRLPNLIDLTSFANGSFHFSSYSYFLLLDCAELTPNSTIIPSGTVAMESPTCGAYKQQCNMGRFSCAQFKPFQELALGTTLDNLSCSHFTFLATRNTSLSVPNWPVSMIQLVYDDIRCQTCLDSGGSCHYDNVTHKFQQCSCGVDGATDSYCSHKSCSGVQCNTSFKIAIGASATVLATIMFMSLLFWVYHKRKRYSTKSFSIPSSNHLLTQRAYMLSKKFGPVATREYSFEELSKATKSFADENMIGDGGFGAVYLGILKDSRKVAVKRLYHDKFRRMDHFYNEIKILSNLDHPNLVKLYGFCCQDSNDLLLVFEYAENGTVFDQLHDTIKPAMPWKTRLTIAMETAEALSYLHNSVMPPIYHRDVKTTNILLDGDLHAKLADFGLSRLVPLEVTHVSTAPQGTPGYLDPDYHQCYQLTDKSDVYSFGVVLVELVSAKLAVDMSRDRREINLSSLALMKIGCGMWEDLVDPRLEMKKNPEVEMMVKRVIELAFMCLHAEKDSRPTMEHVAETLRKLCQECGYGAVNGSGFSFRVDISPPSSMDETRRLIKAKSASKSKHATDSTPSSTTDWSSSNTSLSSANGT